MRSREGKRTRLLIGPEPRGRSDPQLDYYWAGIVRPAAIWLGLSRDEYDSAGEDEMHEILLREVLVPMLPERFLRATPKGERVQGRGSTKGLSLEEMTAYVMRCKDWLARHGFFVEDIDGVALR